MTNPIQGVGAGGGVSQLEQSQMTDEQRASFQEILKHFDPQSFSQSDFEALGGELREAGIGRTGEVRSMLIDAGFDIDQYAASSGGSRGPKGPPPPGSGLDISALATFQEILNDYELSNMSSEEQDRLMGDLTDSGLFRSGLIFNTSG